MFIDTFCRNDLEKNIEFFNIGLGEKNEECISVSSEGNLGDGRVICADQKIPEEYFKQESIRLYRLDSFINTEIYLMKISVEGFEEYVLKGGSKLFEEKKIKYLVRFINGSQQNYLLKS